MGGIFGKPVEDEALGEIEPVRALTSIPGPLVVMRD
jgi:hypothetical protein